MNSDKIKITTAGMNQLDELNQKIENIKQQELKNRLGKLRGDPILSTNVSAVTVSDNLKAALLTKDINKIYEYATQLRTIGLNSPILTEKIKLTNQANDAFGFLLKFQNEEKKSDINQKINQLRGTPANETINDVLNQLKVAEKNCEVPTTREKAMDNREKLKEAIEKVRCKIASCKTPEEKFKLVNVVQQAIKNMESHPSQIKKEANTQTPKSIEKNVSSQGKQLVPEKKAADISNQRTNKTVALYAQLDKALQRTEQTRNTAIKNVQNYRNHKTPSSRRQALFALKNYREMKKSVTSLQQMIGKIEKMEKINQSTMDRGQDKNTRPRPK